MEQQPPAPPSFSNAPASDVLFRQEQQQHEGKPKRHLWVWLVLIVVFGVAVFLILRHKPEATSASHGRGRFSGTVVLNAAEAHSGDMSVKLSAIGTVTPTYTASMTAQVTGQIIAVHYREGQNVRKGDPLIDIDPRPYQAALDTAEGTLAQNQGLLDQAQMDLKRYQDAWQRNAIARQTLDDQEKLVLQDQGLVQSDKGTVEADKVNLAYCHITAPISGKVGLRLVDPGNLVTANGTTTLVVVTQVDPITVVFTIAEDALEQVEAAMHRGGGPLQVEALDRNGVTTLGDGTLISTDNLIDTTTGTIKLRATFRNPQMKLFPNQFVNTELLVNVLHNQTIIPSAAVQQNGTQAFVYVINNNKAKITNIKVVQTDSGNAAVTGIPVGAMVSTSSFEKLQDGSMVKVVSQKIAASDTESNTP